MSQVDEQVQLSLPLESWLQQHGPLSTRSSLLLALRVLAQASRMSDEGLRGSIESLAVPFIERQPRGDWQWLGSAGRIAGTAVRDEDVIERTGVILFTCLAGHAPVHPGTFDALRAGLRLSRPDLPGHLTEVVAKMATARTSSPPLAYDTVADELRRLAALDGKPPRAWPRRGTWLAIAVLALASAGWTWSSEQAETAAPGDLSPGTMTTVALTNEAVDSLALNDEHTTSIQLLLDEEKVLRQELAPDDPRLAWNTVRQAWVRTLAGDDLTAEQLLMNKPTWLDTQLGVAHPYGRAARLMLASVLRRRSAPAAGPLEEAAAQASATLLGDSRRVDDLLAGVPTPTAVLAHVAPNVPAREGFGRDDTGAYRAQLTSTVLWIAERDGWRLHLVARDDCQATFVAGTTPRELTMTLHRVEGRWEAALTGSTPALRATADDSDAVAVSLLGDRERLRLHMGDTEVTGAIDVAAPPPMPPYAVSFRGRTPDACRVVWAEVGLPRTARVKQP